jgi:hypothetical protein
MAAGRSEGERGARDDASGAGPRTIYETDGEAFVPTLLAIGPWDKRLQSGVALSGLAAHLVERAESPVPMITTRLVTDLQRPTPMGAPLLPRVSVVRSGKRLQILQVEILCEGEVVVRSSALRVREDVSPANGLEAPVALPEGLPTMTERSPLNAVLETRLQEGGLEQLGPGVVWARFVGDIVAGVSISPFVQLAMASDFGSGVSANIGWREWTFANVDISLHLLRQPRGAWARVQSRTRSAGNGIAIVDTLLADLEGTVGHAHQTLFVTKSGGG